MQSIVGLVLGGGKGTRLLPLTQHRSKPAVPLAGKYRLIDIPISNCINSGINRIYVLTQFNSASLHRHIRQTYQFDHFDHGFVEILAAQQTNEGADWYQGTADAVRQATAVHRAALDRTRADPLGRPALPHGLPRPCSKPIAANKADVTIAAVPVTREAARHFGIMRINETGRVVGFLEKPKTEQEFALVRSDPAWLDAHGVVSRGRDVSGQHGHLPLQSQNAGRAAGKIRLPATSAKKSFRRRSALGTVQVHLFDGYWEDIGTIRSFYEANLALAKVPPPFAFESSSGPIYTHARSLPPARVDGATIRESLLADGCVIEAGATIEHSVIGLRCHIGRNTVIRNSIVMGADFYASDEPHNGTASDPCLGVCDGSVISGAIIDKNCHIGRNVRIESRHQPDADHDNLSIRDGIIVAHKEAVFPDGWTLPS